MEGLPVLPGYSVSNVSRRKHTVPQQLCYTNGVPLVKKSTVGIGGDPLDTQSVLRSQKDDVTRYDPSLTYGRAKKYVPPAFKPHFVEFDKKTLVFLGYFTERVPDSKEEPCRVRRVTLLYYLEDDTMTVMEPPVENSGLVQGRLVARSRIAKADQPGTYWHWKDLDVGLNISVNSVCYHISCCGATSREYLRSQGLELKPDEPLPEVTTKKQTNIAPPPPRNIEEAHYLERTQKFLLYDKVVLGFEVLREEDGELRPYALNYYLSDDTMEVAEKKGAKCDRDTSKLLLGRSRVPKNWKTLSAELPCYLDQADAPSAHYYAPQDLVVGRTVFIFGKKFLIKNCDNFTRSYYEKNFRIMQPAAIRQEEPRPERPVAPLPPYTGLGSVEDSLQSVYYVTPRTPKKDILRYLLNMNKGLRYSAELDWVHPEDANRRFIIEYKLSEGKTRIRELRVPNGGFTGGTFLKWNLVPLPGSDPSNPEYLTPAHFKLGGVVQVYGHRFRITGLDVAVFRYMEANPDKFSSEEVDRVRGQLLREGLLTDQVCDVAAFREAEAVLQPQLPPEPEKPPS